MPMGPVRIPSIRLHRLLIGTKMLFLGRRYEPASPSRRGGGRGEGRCRVPEAGVVLTACAEETNSPRHHICSLSAWFSPPLSTRGHVFCS